jgi:hypothetical protein
MTPQIPEYLLSFELIVRALVTPKDEALVLKCRLPSRFASRQLPRCPAASRTGRLIRLLRGACSRNLVRSPIFACSCLR